MQTEVTAELWRRGVVTRRFAIKHGMSGPEVDRMVRDGRWVRAWRGVYVDVEVWAGLDEHVGRPMFRGRAASAHLYTPHVLSHDTAALELGLSVLDAASQPVHVTRFGVVGTRHHAGITQHKAPHTPGQIVIVDDRPVLHAARTAMDVARYRGFSAGLVTADSAMASGVPRSAFHEVLEGMVNWPGRRTAVRVASCADPGSESAGETLTRELLLELGHAPRTQFGLCRDGRTAWVDLRVGRHVIEFDGRQKYGAAAADPDALWREKQREDFVRSFRLGMTRVIWADLSGVRRRQLALRLDRDIAETQRLWGRDIADLAAYRPARPRARTVPPSA